MQIVYLVTGIVLGFVIFAQFSGKYEGDKLHQSLRFSVGEYFFHIHHWIYLLVILILISSMGIIIPFVTGFLIGGVVQGLGYRNRFIVLYKKRDFHKLYKRFGLEK